MVKYKFILENLNCAHCAAKIEEKIKKEYSDVTFNFINKELILYSDKDSECLVKEIQEIVNSIEAGVTVKAVVNSALNSCEHKHCRYVSKDIIKFFVGIVIFAFGLGLKQNLLLIIAYAVLGYDVIFRAFKNLIKGQLFDENFLMTIATFGALYIKEFPEAVAVMLFYQLGEIFQDMAVEKSRRSIKELMGLKIEYVNKLVNDEIKIVKPEEICINDIIIVKPGEKVPLDAVVIDGESYIDTSALTGEAVPVKVTRGSIIKSGVINKDAALKLCVEKLYEDSTVVKIMAMVEDAVAKKSNIENYITKFAKIYTPIVVSLAILIAVVPSLIVGNFNTWLYRALIFLVSSCPCALVVSIPLTFFSGIGSASKNGILIKGSNYLQMLSSIDTVVFDKTGTITEGIFKVREYTDDKTLLYASSLEKYSNHPIANAVLESCNDNLLAVNNVKEISGYGLEGEIGEKNIYVGNIQLMKKQGIDNLPEFDDTAVYVSEGNNFIGYIIVSDTVKKDSKPAVDKLKKLGIDNLVMLTGDKNSVAEKISNQVGIDTCYAQLLPQDKVYKLEELLENHKVAFVGDGINDAPVLARADLGIAMGGIGSDAAIEAADMVIMNDSLLKLSEGISLARYTIKKVKQNISFVLIIKFMVLFLAIIGLGNMWLAVFADVGVALLAVLNATR